MKRLNICKKKLEKIEDIQEKTRKDSIYVSKNQKGLNICKKKNERRLNICKKKIEKIQYM